MREGERARVAAAGGDCIRIKILIEDAKSISELDFHARSRHHAVYHQREQEIYTCCQQYTDIDLDYQLLLLLFLKKRGFAPAKYGDLLSQLKIEDENFFKNSVMSLLKNGVLVKQGQSVKI